MIAASSLAFPGSKTLAGWRSQLAHFEPQAMWVGHLFLHRLEALAEVVHFESIDELHLLLLRAVALEDKRTELPHNNNGQAAAEVDWLGRLDDRLRLSRPLIHGLLQDLRGKGLVTPAPMAALTAPGRFALVRGHYPSRSTQRREFTFVERLRPDGGQRLPPHFLAVSAGPAQRWQPSESNPFDVGWLRKAAGESQEWKDLFAFPADVAGIVHPAEAGQDDPSTWQRVVIDRPERLLVALIAVAGPPAKLLIFAARQEGWLLRGDQPIGSVPASARAEFPDLAELPDWTKSWQDWCKLRGLPAAEVQACTIAGTAGEKIEVSMPKPLHDHLAAAKSDLLKGDAWLLAGDGYLRAAAKVEVVAKPDPGLA